MHAVYVCRKLVEHAQEQEYQTFGETLSGTWNSYWNFRDKCPPLSSQETGLDGPLSCTGSSQRNENHLARYWILDRCVEREKSKLSKESSQVKLEFSERGYPRKTEHPGAPNQTKEE